LTALRLYPPAGQDLHAAAQRFEQALLTRLEAGAGGLRVEPVREQALAAARGNVDFAGLFIGFSSFLILAAALLVALLMRLGVEQRAAELGVLLAVGFTPRRTARVLLTESLWLAAIGALLGLAGARVFAGAMLAGLRGGWSAAVNAPFLQLHVERASLAAGWLATVAVAAVAMFLGVRGLSRQPARALLAGDTGTSRAAATAGRGRLWPAVLAGGALLLAGAAALLPGFPETLGFFGSGALLLAACVLFVRGRLRARPAGFIPRPGWWSIVRLGLRNAPRHAGRSTATVALMACATFVIAAMQAFRLEAGEDVDDPRSGSGGYDMVAESTVPLLADPGTPEGRAALDLPSGAEAALNGVTVMPLRLRPGDDASCTNLYAATQQRIAGAPEAFITRGGFRFSDWLSGTGANPWLLLHHEFEDGAVPAIGDAAAVKWQLHRGLGQDLVVTGGDGRPRRLRFVALLEGSVLQDEIIVSERQFTRLFPQRSGYAFFLIDAPRGSAGAVGTELERLLNRYGFDVRPSSERLAGYFAVQNTYLSVFQSLGGLGLLLGSCGLGAVLLRNVWERRSELAVLRAVGFARRDLGWMVLAENALLVMLGLAAGIVPAAVAVAPHMVHRPQSLALGSLLIILSAVFAASMLSSIAALVSALRAPLVPALRKE
jgi:ABC-type lipoprotein release transport system permease subunit